MKTYPSFITVIFLFASCFIINPVHATAPETDINQAPKFTVSPADDWNNLLIHTSGWLMADGIYSINMSGKETYASDKDSILFLFSDSFMGNIKDEKLQSGCTMVNNTVALLKGNKPDPKQIQFFWKKESDHMKAVFVPKEKKVKEGRYFWLGDGFVNADGNKNLYVFTYEMKNTGSGAFGFEQTGTTLLVIPQGSKPPFNSYKQIELPFSFKDENGKDTNPFGAGIFVNTKNAGSKNPDDYIYIYGVYGRTKKVAVARVLPNQFEDFSEWRFWNGNEWDKDINHATAVTDRVSNELSLTQLPDGRYALIFQIDGIGSYVAMRLANQPQGPFGSIIKLWDCPEVKVSPNFYVYNAKAHPVISPEGELIISYNVNTFKFLEDLNTHTNFFRPRFIRVKFENLLSK